MLKKIKNVIQRADALVLIDDEDTRQTIQVFENNQPSTLFVFRNGEDIKGKVKITLKYKDVPLKHRGISISICGILDDNQSEQMDDSKFIHTQSELISPGLLENDITIDFSFPNAQLPHESYYGNYIKLWYCFIVEITGLITKSSYKYDFYVQSTCKYSLNTTGLFLEVGIEGCIHIQLKLDKTSYPLDGVILGNILFQIVRNRVKSMEISILKREILNEKNRIVHEEELLTDYEIMDGMPNKGQCIPIRLYLKHLKLTPTMVDINQKFSIRTFINLSILDDFDRRYFKHEEIFLWRPSKLSTSKN